MTEQIVINAHCFKEENFHAPGQNMLYIKRCSPAVRKLAGKCRAYLGKAR